MRTRMQPFYLQLSLIITFSPWIVVGCSDDDLGPRYRVSGRVTRLGQPITTGSVNFLPVESTKGRPATGPIQTDGSYQLMTVDPGDGALAGDYRVVISLVDIDDSKLPKTPGGMPILNQPKSVKVKNLVPPKYSDPAQTVLAYKVEARSNTYDLDLTE